MNLYDEMVEHYHKLHQLAEGSFQEYQTQQYLLNVLKQYPLIIHIIGTGVLAYLDNSKKNIIGFRAEEDALPIEEQTFVDFKCNNKMMHACGHDAHMAMLLGLIHYSIISQTKLNHNYLFIFEPGEETTGGSKMIIKDEFFLNHLPKVIFSLHGYPNVEKGKIHLTGGPILSKCVEFNLIIKGKSAHVASQEEGKDALRCGIEFYNAIFNYLKHKKSIKYLIGKFDSGVRRNIVSDFNNLEGTLRAFDDKKIDKVYKFINKWILQKQRHGYEISLYFHPDYDVVYNNKAVVKWIKKNYLIQTIKPQYISDSFGCFYPITNICYALIGLESSSLHSSTFQFNEEVLMDGLNFYISVLNINSSVIDPAPRLKGDYLKRQRQNYLKL